MDHLFNLIERDLIEYGLSYAVDKTVVFGLLVQLVDPRQWGSGLPRWSSFRGVGHDVVELFLVCFSLSFVLYSLVYFL